MSKSASKVVEQAKAWIGYNESDGSHKRIIDIYNGQKSLPGGYKVKYTDAWCATFVSAVAVQLGYTDVIPTECSCSRMINLFKKKGIWIENENRKPNPGDILFYDWDDTGSGDNKGDPDHVGIVEKVVGNVITVIEGNYSKSVKRRMVPVNGRNIRGYGVPKYEGASEGTSEYTLKAFIRDVQGAINAKVDGIAGPETISKTPTLSSKRNNTHKCVLFVQKRLLVLGYVETGKADGIFGPKTTSAIAHFQINNACAVDGIITARNKTWKKLLGMI